MIDQQHVMAIAVHLGDQWSCTFPCSFSATLHGPDDHVLTVDNGDDGYRSRDNGYLIISASCGDLAQLRHQPGYKLSIRVATHRTAEVAAADITRRLLPQYQQERARMRCQQRAEQEHRAAVRQQACEVAALLGRTWDPARGYIALGDVSSGMRGEIRPSLHGDWKVQLSISPTHISTVAAALAALTSAVLADSTPIPNRAERSEAPPTSPTR